jgi:PAS domain S-box-containing protein
MHKIAGRQVGAGSILSELVDPRRIAEQRNAELAAIVAASGDAIISVGTDLTVRTWNAGAQRLLGYDEAETYRRPIGDLFAPDIHQTDLSGVCAAAAASGTAVLQETVCRRKDGCLVPVEACVSPLLGSVTGFSIILRDITGRKRTEARLAEREAQLALFVEHAPAAIAMFDTRMICLAASRRFMTDYRLPAHVKVIGTSHYEVFPEIPPRWREIHRRVLAGEELSAEEDPLLRADGRIDWCRWTMTPWRTSDGRIGGALLFTEVINDQVEGRRALAESEARFRATFENAAVGIAHVAPDGRWLRVNDALCRILGYTADELLTKSFQEVTHPDDLNEDLAHLALMHGEKIGSYGGDRRYLRKDGTVVWVRRTISSVRKGDRSIDYFVIVVEDITSRKHAEQELRKSEERFRSSLVHSPLPILLYDDREQIIAISQTWLDESGYSRQELRCMEDWTVRACGERSGEVLEYIRQTISMEPEVLQIERLIRTKDGRERIWSIVNSCLGPQSDGRRLFIAVSQDITERKAHEEQVHLLIREINHRAKNMLSLVQAVARQTAAREPGEFIDRFTERIQALAANQDLLVRNEWRGVDVEELVRAQLALFADLVGTRIAVHGTGLRLNAAAAQAIGLALHELATNAGKYGALSSALGRVDIDWGMANGDAFTMSWSEREGPPVSAPARRGFGSIVMDAMAARSVSGSVDLNYEPSGVTWRLTCPAANVLERIVTTSTNGHPGLNRRGHVSTDEPG